MTAAGVLRRTGALGAATVLLAGLAAALGATPAGAAEEVYPMPSGGSLTIDGHGFGHGRGMSQWGAKQAGAEGASTAAILAFYYPDTIAGSAGARPLAVTLTNPGPAGTPREGVPPTGSGDARYECDAASSVASRACRLDVLNAAGVTVTAGSASYTSADATRWEVRKAGDGSGFVLARLGPSGWTNVATRLAGPVTFTTSGAPLTVAYADGTQRAYRGQVQAVSTAATRFLRLDVLGVDDYLRGVVAGEMPASWGAAALGAQAVAARSYALASAAGYRAEGRRFDICDSTYCQYYLGVSAEDPRSDAAVAATAGQVRTSGGAPARTEFSSSNGGWTATTAAVPAKADGWDARSPNPYGDWTVTVTEDQLAALAGLARASALRVTAREGNAGEQWGGRVTAVYVDGVDATGAARSVPVSPRLDGLRSSWWKPRAAAPVALTLTGPSTAERGSTVTLRGTATPGRTVEVMTQRQGASGYTVRASLTVGADGRFSSSYLADVDYRYFARYADARATASRLGTTLARGTTISAPTSVARGATLSVSGLAAPGAPVAVRAWDGATRRWAAVGWGRADAAGRWSASWTARASYRSFATAAGYHSPTVATTVR